MKQETIARPASLGFLLIQVRLYSLLLSSFLNAKEYPRIQSVQSHFLSFLYHFNVLLFFLEPLLKIFPSLSLLFFFCDKFCGIVFFRGGFLGYLLLSFVLCIFGRSQFVSRHFEYPERSILGRIIVIMGII